jgi:hypothetical protein
MPISGTLIDLSGIGVFDYCVEGDRLALYRVDAPAPELAVAELERAP